MAPVDKSFSEGSPDERVWHRQAWSVHTNPCKKNSAACYPTEARAGGFAVITALGRYAGAGLVFVIAALITAVGLGDSLAYASIAFVIGMVLLAFVKEDRNRQLDRSVDKMVLDAAQESQ